MPRLSQETPNPSFDEENTMTQIDDDKPVKAVLPSRKRSMRREEMRPQIHMDYLSPLEIPHSMRKEGYSYAWIRKSIRGEDDFRVEQMAARGWTPVPSSRCPALSFDPLDRNPLSKNFICYKDLLLMERPSVHSQREEEAFHRMNHHRLNSLRGVADDLRDLHKPLPGIHSF
jgi:hypothetical protein